jgi:hypothetical protein
MAYNEKTHEMKPSPTAPPGARTAGPNGSFRIDDAKHARLAIGAATRSERAGHISPAEEAHIKTEARQVLHPVAKRGTRQQESQWKRGRNG